MSFKNFVTDRTDMPDCNKKFETFLSDFISSSLVIRYFALPLTAVSMIKSSSLSLQILTSPETKTCSDRYSINIKSFCISASVIPYLSFILGRLRTSAISFRIGSEMTASKSPSSNAFRILAGYPNGLSNADTHTFVSITTLNATFFFSDLFHGLSDICFYFFSGVLGSFLMDLFNKTVKSPMPFIFGKDPYLNPFVFLHIYLLDGLKDPIFIYCLYGFWHIQSSPSFQEYLKCGFKSNEKVEPLIF